MMLELAQNALGTTEIDAWIVYDFRQSNPILRQLLGRSFNTTRRLMLVLRADRAPSLLVSAIDASLFAGLGITLDVYQTWQEWRAGVARATSNARRIAMEYSPLNELPAASFADAGAVELVRSFGVEVVSSADLIQLAVATWGADAVREHERVSRIVAQIKDEAFALIGSKIDSGITEFEVQQFIWSRFDREGLDGDHPPIVGANAHSGDPHFAPSATLSSKISRGDWVLIDLWARTPGERNIFSDITWCGFVGQDVPEEHLRVFNAVTAARDAALALCQSTLSRGERLEGWQLDRAAQDVLINAGLAHGIKHRTGHSLSPGPKVHGLGANLDDFETHDTRTILPGTGFTIEPGIYLPTFGVRSEINVYVDPARGAIVTSPIQRDVVLIGSSAK